MYPCFSTLTYDFQQSEIIGFPRAIHSLIIGRKVVSLWYLTMSCIVYVKLQNVAFTRLNLFQQNKNNEFYVQIASYLVVLGFALILHFCEFYPCANKINHVMTGLKRTAIAYLIYLIYLISISRYSLFSPFP